MNWGMNTTFNMLDIPVKFAAAAYDFYKNFTDMEQPVPKLDLVVVPGRVRPWERQSCVHSYV